MTNSDRMPDLHIEQYVLGEATEEVSRKIEANPELLGRANMLKVESETFLRAVPPALVVPKIVTAAGNGRGRRVFQEKRQLFVPLLAAAALALTILPVYLAQKEMAGDTAGLAGGDRVKGLEPDISIYRNDTDGEAVELSDGSDAGAGDALQIVYSAAGAKFGVIFSVDGRGVVTLHYPSNIFASAALDQGANIALPYSYVLDDSPGFERFFFLTSADELSVQTILERAETLAESDPEAVQVGAFTAIGIAGEELTLTKTEASQ